MFSQENMDVPVAMAAPTTSNLHQNQVRVVCLACLNSCPLPKVEEHQLSPLRAPRDLNLSEQPTLVVAGLNLSEAPTPLAPKVVPFPSLCLLLSSSLVSKRSLCPQAPDMPLAARMATAAKVSQFPLLMSSCHLDEFPSRRLRPHR